MVICNFLLVNPATSAIPGRSFSMARYIKVWLRSTMAQSRFNSLGILHCHKEWTDNLDLSAAANKFVNMIPEDRSLESSPGKILLNFEIMRNNLSRT